MNTMDQEFIAGMRFSHCVGNDYRRKYYLSSRIKLRPRSDSYFVEVIRFTRKEEVNEQSSNGFKTAECQHVSEAKVKAYSSQSVALSNDAARYFVLYYF